MNWLSALESLRLPLAICLVAGFTGVSCANRNSAPAGGDTPGLTGGESAVCNSSNLQDCETSGGLEGGDTPGSGGDTGTFNLCDSLKSNNDLSQVDSLVQTLCSSGLKRLRDEDVVYQGGSSAKILENAEELGDQKTDMRLESSILVETTPKAYFEMSQLQFKKPSVYSDEAGFETDPHVVYSIQDSKSDSVRYIYENNKEDDKVKYEAVTRFITLKEGVAYATATVLDDSDTTPLVVLKLKGLIVIVKKGDKSEVFSLSNQTYDNSGDHESTKERAIENVKEEQKRHFRNAKEADKAGQYL